MKRQRILTVTQKIMLEASESENMKSLRYDKTREQYIRNFKQFVKFCRKKYDCKTLADCQQYIQVYTDYLLKDLHHTPATAHTYLAALCKVYGLKMADFDKAIRHSADTVRGRKRPKSHEKKRDLDDPCWKYLCDFQRAVGIRRNELLHLTGNDFVYDESGKPCIRVKRGKGGKMQLQRFNEKYTEQIKAYFVGVEPDERIFPPELFRNNQLNLHHLRAESAKEFYYTELAKLNADPKYAETILAEIKARWNLYNLTDNGKPKIFNEANVTGYYYLRGKNRKFASEHGIPIKFNKLVLMYTSITKLAHWRNNVCISHYIISVYE